MRINTLFWMSFLLTGPIFAETPDHTGLNAVPLRAEEESIQITVAQDNLAFGLELFHAQDQGKTSCISPYSIASALFIPYAGAEGLTKEEMGMVLGFKRPVPIMADAFSGLNRTLTYHPSNFPDSFRLLIANSLWVQNESRLIPSFLKVVQNELGGTVRPVDFIKQTEATRDRINDWVSRETNSKITNLLAEGSVTQQTQMVVVSALYLKGEWMYPFNADNTHMEPFFAGKEVTQTLPMMTQTEVLDYYEDDTLQAVDMPLEYTGKVGPKIAMTFILPKGGEEVFTAEKIQQIQAGMQRSRVALTLPKFQIRHHLSVKDSLIKLGMEVPFTSKADFSGIMKDAELTISDVIHETYLNVEEAGIEAAAATAVVMMKTSLPTEPPKVFRADKPFYFIIKDSQSGVALFLGRFYGNV